MASYRMKVRAYTLVAATWAVGTVSLLLWGLFLWRGGVQFVDLRMTPFTTLAWDGILSLVFFLQHSGMVRRSFQAWLGRFLPSRHHRAVYTIASGAALLLLVSCWQPSDIRILVLGGAAHWLVRILFHLRGTTRPQTQLTIRGHTSGYAIPFTRLSLLRFGRARCCLPTGLYSTSSGRLGSLSAQCWRSAIWWRNMGTPIVPTRPTYRCWCRFEDEDGYRGRQAQIEARRLE